MRLVIADDSAVVRDGLLHALQAHGHEVVGTAADGAELLACVQRERPQVALVDIRMPPTHTSEGLDAASTIRKRAPDVAVLVLSQYVDADYALTLLRESPARSGYVLKDRVAELTTLLEAIGRVARAARPWSIRSSSSCCCTVPRPRPGSRSSASASEPCWRLLAEGFSDRAIAGRLWLTPKTVETHVRHILAKLGLSPDADHNRRVLAVLTYLRSQG